MVQDRVNLGEQPTKVLVRQHITCKYHTRTRTHGELGLAVSEIA